MYNVVYFTFRSSVVWHKKLSSSSNDSCADDCPVTITTDIQPQGDLDTLTTAHLMQPIQVEEDAVSLYYDNAVTEPKVLLGCDLQPGTEVYIRTHQVTTASASSDEDSSEGDVIINKQKDVVDGCAFSRTVPCISESYTPSHRVHKYSPHTLVGISGTATASRGEVKHVLTDNIASQPQTQSEQHTHLPNATTEALHTAAATHKPNQLRETSCEATKEALSHTSNHQTGGQIVVPPIFGQKRSTSAGPSTSKAQETNKSAKMTIGSQSCTEIFRNFSNATEFKDILAHFRTLCQTINIDPIKDHKKVYG